MTNYKYPLAEDCGHSDFMSRLHDVAPEEQQNTDVVWLLLVWVTCYCRPSFLPDLDYHTCAPNKLMLLHEATLPASDRCQAGQHSTGIWSAVGAFGCIKTKLGIAAISVGGCVAALEVTTARVWSTNSAWSLKNMFSLESRGPNT